MLEMILGEVFGSLYRSGGASPTTLRSAPTGISAIANNRSGPSGHAIVATNMAATTTATKACRLIAKAE
jgi:hypothetical protein